MDNDDKIESLKEEEMYLVVGILLAFIREFVALCVKLKWLFMFFYGLLFLALLFLYKGILW